MSWAAIGENRGPKGHTEPDEPVRSLPMDMTSDAALEAWFDEWMRATDPEGRSGTSLHLSAFRTRFERLLAAERTGIPAAPVTLPRDCVAARPTHFAHVVREGRHLDIKTRAALTRHVLQNRARRRKRKI